MCYCLAAGGPAVAAVVLGSAVGHCAEQVAGNALPPADAGNHGVQRWGIPEDAAPHGAAPACQ